MSADSIPMLRPSASYKAARAEVVPSSSESMNAICKPTIMKFMFFRRETPKNPTFEQRMETLRKAGFTVTPLAGGGVRVSRGDCATDLKEDGGTVRGMGRAGMRMGDE